MFNTATDINQGVDPNQPRTRLTDPQDPKTSLITNLLVYCSQYYPATKTLATDAVKLTAQDHLPELYAALMHLYGCLEKEIIVGPSSSHFPPIEVPKTAKLDSSLSLSPQTQSPLGADLDELSKAFKELQFEKILPLERLHELQWYNCSHYLSMRTVQQNTVNFKQYRSQLQLDGQSWLESTPFSGMVALIQFLLDLIVTQIQPPPAYVCKFRLLWARLSYLHNKHLKSPVKKLSSIVLGNYRQVLALSLKGKTTIEGYVELLLEYAFALLFYYKYSQSEEVIRHCAVMLKMKMEFTGKLGRRTKYQVFDTPLLVMDLVSQNQPEVVETKEEKEDREYEEDGDEIGNKVQLIDAKELVNRERNSQGQTSEGLTASMFNEECILLQTPKFVEEEEGKAHKNELREVGEQHLLVALAMLYFQWKSVPHDEMLLQNISTAVATLLKYNVPTSYSYSFALLLLRSLNQFPKLKNVERALDQFELLKTFYNNRPQKNISNIYSTPYETNLEFVLILADKYMEIGLSMTAVELFEQAGLFEECIDGLIAKGYKEKAEELTHKLIDEKGKNARLLCMLGDINNDKGVEEYEEAWEMSNQTCARAQRSLGWYYYGKKDFVKAAESFTKATQASFYHPSTWYTLGCCYMKAENYEKALKAFSECISIDDSQGEAWGNMASCYMHAKKLNEAYSTLLQAVKYSEANWKLWLNLLSVSLTLKKFYKYFECIERIVKLGHQELITEEMFAKVVQIMKYQNESSSRKRALFSFKNRIDRLFQVLGELIGENPLVWRTATNYAIEMLQYYDILNVHYHNLHIKKELDVNDLVPEYETIQSTTLNTELRVTQTRSNIVEFKQTELNMCMKVGWDENKLVSQRVKVALEEYVDIYRQYSTRKDKEDFRLFVGGVAMKLSHCLEEEYTVPLQWL